MTHLTCTCGKPIHDNAAICPDCTDGLTQALATLADLWPQLELTITRQDAIGTTAGDNDGRVYFNTAASEAGHALRNTITTWARVVTEETGQQPPPPTPQTRGPRHLHDCRHHSCRALGEERRLTPHEVRLLRWLTGLVPRIRNRDFAPELVDEMCYAAALLERTIDRPPSLQFVGPCDVCSEDLYVKHDSAQVKCRKCELTYDVVARREWLLGKAEDHLGTATEVARAVTNLGTPVTPERVWKWASRGRLVARGRHGRRPLYRVGDVLNLAYCEPRRAGAA